MSAFYCSICLSAIEKMEKIGHLRCGHIYHNECIARWYKNKRTCPVCRERVPAPKTIFVQLCERPVNSVIGELKAELSRLKEMQEGAAKESADMIIKLYTEKQKVADEASKANREIARELEALRHSTSKQRVDLLESQLRLMTSQLHRTEKENENIAASLAAAEKANCDQVKELRTMEQDLKEQDERIALFRVELALANKTLAEKEYELQITDRKCDDNAGQSGAHEIHTANKRQRL